MGDPTQVDLARAAVGPADVAWGSFILLLTSFGVAVSLLVTALYPSLDDRTRIAMFMVESSVVCYPWGVWMIVRPREFLEPDPDSDGKEVDLVIFRVMGLVAVGGATVMLAFLFVL